MSISLICWLIFPYLLYLIWLSIFFLPLNGSLYFLRIKLWWLGRLSVELIKAIVWTVMGIQCALIEYIHHRQQPTSDSCLTATDHQKHFDVCLMFLFKCQTLTPEVQSIGNGDILFSFLSCSSCTSSLFVLTVFSAMQAIDALFWSSSSYYQTSRFACRQKLLENIQNVCDLSMLPLIPPIMVGKNCHSDLR